VKLKLVRNCKRSRELNEFYTQKELDQYSIFASCGGDISGVAEDFKKTPITMKKENYTKDCLLKDYYYNFSAFDVDYSEGFCDLTFYDEVGNEVGLSFPCIMMEEIIKDYRNEQA